MTARPPRSRVRRKPAVHGLGPDGKELRAKLWHRLIVHDPVEWKALRLLQAGLLTELRQCPHCLRPLLRWRPFAEVRRRVFRQSLMAAGGDAHLACRRLDITTQTLNRTLTRPGP